jgi:hypothetical protein
MARIFPFGRRVSALERASVVVVLEEVVVSAWVGGDGMVLEVTVPGLPPEVEVVLATVPLVVAEAVVDVSSPDPQPTTPQRAPTKMTATTSRVMGAARCFRRHGRLPDLYPDLCSMMSLPSRWA